MMLLYLKAKSGWLQLQFSQLYTNLIQKQVIIHYFPTSENLMALFICVAFSNTTFLVTLSKFLAYHG